MNVLDSEDDLGYKEASFIFIKYLTLIQMMLEITSSAQIQYQVQVRRCLERVVEFYYERMGKSFENISLTNRVLEVLAVHKRFLVQNFHRERISLRIRVAFQVYFKDFAKGALSKSLLDFPRFESYTRCRIII